MKDISLDSYKALIQKKLRRRRKSAIKGVEKLLFQLKSAEKWKTIEREGLVLQANLYQIKPGAKQARFVDWESEQELVINLDPLIPAADQIKKRIRQSKKFKAGIPHLEKQLVQAQNWVKNLDDALLQVEGFETLEEIKAIEEKFDLSPSPKTVEQLPLKKLPYKEYHSSNGVAIWVGKGAKDNDQLTFTYANGSDWWLHVNEFAGSHVIIRAPQHVEPDNSTLQEAIQLAIGQSKAPKRGKVEVCVTQVKHVKKFKGAKSGAVHISKHKKILGEFDKALYDAILRLLP